MVKMPHVTESHDSFHTEIHIPPELAYTSDWAPPSLSAEMANIGTIDCGTFPALHNYFRDKEGRIAGLGARGRSDPAYKGEVFVADGVGRATIESWSPNVVKVSVTGAQPGEHVILNQNWDPGWSANGEETTSWSDQVAAQLHATNSTVVFRYRPTTFLPGVLVFVLTVGWLAAAHRLRRRIRAGSVRGAPRPTA
jgi:hypothetical protein